MIQQNIALILAGGSGSRITSNRPKQYIEIEGESILLRTIRAFESHPDITAICIVCQAEWQDYVRGLLAQGNIRKFAGFAEAGETGFQSLKAGVDFCQQKFGNESLHSPKDLNAISGKIVVLIHDAVRPLVTQEIITNNIHTCRQYGNAITGCRSDETLMRSSDGKITLDFESREAFRRAQTPQTFFLEECCEMIEEIEDQRLPDPESAVVMAYLAGHTPLHIVEGDLLNFKITLPDDLLIYRALRQVESWR